MIKSFTTARSPLSLLVFIMYYCFLFLLLSLTTTKHGVVNALWIRPVVVQQQQGAADSTGSDAGGTASTAITSGVDRNNNEHHQHLMDLKSGRRKPKTSSRDKAIADISSSSSSHSNYRRRQRQEDDWRIHVVRSDDELYDNENHQYWIRNNNNNPYHNSNSLFSVSSKYTNPFVQIYSMLRNYYYDTLQNEMMYIFETRHAQNIVDGIVLAGKNICLGCYEGCKQAYECVKQGQPGNAIAILPTMMFLGLKTGLRQLIQGAANPDNKRNDDSTSSTTNRYYYPSDYSLDTEDWELQQRLALEGDVEHRPPSLQSTTRTQVKDTTYYDILEISTNATKSEIKRACRDAEP